MTLNHILLNFIILCYNVIMKIIIDTNIAYYLSNISRETSFSIERFKHLTDPIFISSVSLLEIYYKYGNNEKFKIILSSLNNFNIGIILYGRNFKKNEKPSINKLLKRSKSYTKRIMNYFKEIYIDELANNIYYLGSLIGGLYIGLLELFEKKIKLSDFEFKFITYTKSLQELKKFIAIGMSQQYMKIKNRDSSFFYENIENLLCSSIALYNVKKYNMDLSTEQAKDYYHKNRKIELSPVELLSQLLKCRNYKIKDIFHRFEECLDYRNADICFKCLITITESFFSNKYLKINDLTDSIILSMSNIDKDFCFITNDKTWKRFLLELSNSYQFAKDSINIMKKIFINS